jgi:putative membrane protein
MLSMSDRPRVFRIETPDRAGDDAAMRTREGLDVAATVAPLDRDDAQAEIAAASRRRRSFRWLWLFMSAAGGFVFLAIGVSVQSFVADLLRSNSTLGYAALGLALLALLGLVGFLFREAVSIWRAARVERLARDVAAARASVDLADGRRLARALVALYASRPDTARGRSRVEEIDADLIDARGRLAIAERELLAALDAKARGAVAAAASRVALLTTISPRALIAFCSCLAPAWR